RLLIDGLVRRMSPDVANLADAIQDLTELLRDQALFDEDLDALHEVVFLDTKVRSSRLQSLSKFNSSRVGDVSIQDTSGIGVELRHVLWEKPDFGRDAIVRRERAHHQWWALTRAVRLQQDDASAPRTSNERPTARRSARTRN